MNRYKCPACGRNQYTSCDTAEGCIYCGHQKLEKMDKLEPEESEGMKMKPDGVSDDIFNDLVNALDKAIMLIYDMSIRKVAFPGDMIRRWENLVKYARAKESEVEQDEANNQV